MVSGKVNFNLSSEEESNANDKDGDYLPESNLSKARQDPTINVAESSTKLNYLMD